MQSCAFSSAAAVPAKPSMSVVYVEIDECIPIPSFSQAWQSLFAKSQS